MPGCITHYIFAKDCFDKLDNNNLKNILSKNINIYLLGRCGPNIAIMFLIYFLKI